MKVELELTLITIRKSKDLAKDAVQDERLSGISEKKY